MRSSFFIVAVAAMAGCGGRTPLGDEPLGAAGARNGDGTRKGDAGELGGGGAPGGNPADVMPPENAGPVHGTVVDAEGRSYPGVELQLGSTMTVTDSDGHFAFASAPAIYEVSAVLYRQGVYVFSGLSRRDPTLRIYDRYSLENPSHHGRATVNMPSADTATIKAVTFFELTEPVPFHSYNVDKIDQATHFHVFWTGSDAVKIRLHAIQYEVDPTTGAPRHFIGYDTTDRMIAEADDIDWTPAWKGSAFAEATIAAKTLLPTGYDVWQVRLFIKPTVDGPPFFFASSRQTEPQVSFLVPDMPNAAFEIEVLTSSPRAASDRRATKLTPRLPADVLEVEEGPSLGSPAEGAVGVGVGTILRWTNPTNRAAFVQINLEGDKSYPSYYLVTGGNSVAIPDLTNRGITLPRNVRGHWEAFSMSATTADDLAASGNTTPALPQSTHAYSGFRSFTTK